MTTSPTSSLKSIDINDVEVLALGAGILGTGGGGDPYIGMLLAREALRANGPVEVVALADVPDDAVVISVGMVGAPTVVIEKLATFEPIDRVIHDTEKALGQSATHIACVEVGGINSMTPIAAAARLGLPVIDGDGMGRAFPGVDMTLPHLHRIPASPIVLGDDRGDCVTIHGVDGPQTEVLTRAVTVAMGCSVISSNRPMTGPQARDSLVPNSLSRCLAIGDAVGANTSAETPAVRLAGALGGRMISQGKVVDVDRRTEAGFSCGSVVIDGLHESTGTETTIDFQNENLVVAVDMQVVTTVPDLVVVVDAQTARPITTESLSYGQRVAVLTAPSDPRWHSAAGYRLAGPRAFGYDIDPVRWDGPPDRVNAIGAEVGEA